MAKRIIKATIIVFGTVVVAFLLGLIFRDSILHHYVEKYQKRFSERYPAHVLIGNMRFSGLAAVKIDNISLVPLSGDTLIHVDSVYSRLDLLSSLLGNVSFSDLKVYNTKIKIVRRDSSNNFSFLFRKARKDSLASSNKEVNFSKALNTVINAFFDKVPDYFSAHNSQVSILWKKLRFNMMLPDFKLEDKQLSAQLVDHSSEVEKRWFLRGRIDSWNEQMEYVVYSENSSGVEVPFLKDRFGLVVSCDTLHFSLDSKEYSGDQLQMSGNATFVNLKLNHPKLSPNDIIVKRSSVDYTTRLGKNFIEVDSATVVHLNKMMLLPYARYEKRDTAEKIYTLQVHTPKIPSQDFFESLPIGLCKTLEGIQTAGSLAYKLDFTINTKEPDKLHFDSRLEKENFRIIKYGETVLTKINGPFTYTAYERGQPVRSFVVGPENPDFTPYNQVSDYLKQALITSEDGTFFYHKGFNEEAFAKSIATNFKKGRFAKGGSTISMQLVKNVFLTRNKTISRKIEEALIVWLIENNHLSSKERMYEVYLNVIEWGPNVYGIGEASRFYFNKHPSELTLEESIYLACIVPSPKAFRYFFDSEGNLKKHLEGYFKLVGGRLLRKGAITQEQYDNLEANVTLHGRAKNLVVPDSVPTDEELEDDGNDLLLLQNAFGAPASAHETKEQEKEKGIGVVKKFIQNFFKKKKKSEEE